MERQEFLKTLGVSFAAVCAGACLASCGGGDDTSTPGNTTQPPATGGTVTANLSSLTAVGSSTKVGAVLFFRIATGDVPASFVATEAQCPHQAGNLNWIQSQDLIRCDLHSAEYQKNGSVISQPVGGGTTRTLKIYSTIVNSTSVVATLS